MPSQTFEVRRAELKIECSDGSEATFKFFYLDEPFPVLMEKEMGFPKAQLGSVSFTFPRWPAASSFSPKKNEEDRA